MKMLDFFVRKRRIRSSLLIIFMTFIILPALAVGIFSYVQSKNVLERSVFNTLEYLIDAEENAITNWSDNRKNFLVGLANNQRIKSMDYATAKRILENSLNMDKNFKTIVLVGTDGKIKVEPFKSKVSHTYIGDRAYIQQAMKGETYVSEVLLSRNTKEPVIFIATPVKQKDEIVGILFGVVKIEVITNLVQQTSLGELGETYLVNQQGFMVSQSKFLQEFTSLRLKVIKEPLNQFSEGNNSRGIYKNYRNKKVFGVYRNLTEIKIGLVAEMEYHSAMMKYGLQTYFLAVVASGLIVVVFLLFGVYYSRKLSKPLEFLAAEVISIAEGNYRSIISIPANTEIQELSTAINHMSANILEKTNQLNNLIEQLEQYTNHLNQKNYQLAQISITDELTGLYNRRYLNQEIERLIVLSGSMKKNISLFMLDLDHFKQVNDNYGHATGDVVLKEFAQLLRSCSRDHDVVGRFGGEEFILIVPFVRGQQVKELGERIRQDVENFVFDRENYRLRITVSIGIATFTPLLEEPVGDIAEKLLKTADDCLYQAKETGRNKVIQVILNEENT
ncbi:sensor domain-containing diguanylate cyclase [Desulfotomaculum defluvii]